MQHAVIGSLSEGEYLAVEGGSRVKHEYVAGEVFAIAGASKAHGTLALTSLSRCARTCAERDLAGDAPADYVEAPKLVEEVLSPSTEHIVRREKLLAYRRLPSLAEYMLVDQERRWVEIYRRTDIGWSHDIYQPGDVIDIGSVGMSLDFDSLYEDSGVS